MLPTRLFDIPYAQAASNPLKKSIAGKTLGKYKGYSTQEFIDAINLVSVGLWQMGVRPGDKIALISHNNRPEWNIMDYGMMQIGAINVPVYPTISPREYVYIFNDASVKYVVVGYGDLLQKVREAQPQVPSLREIFTFDETPGAPHWESIFGSDDEILAHIQTIKASIKPEDMATIIYTSGTTGDPKGVMLSHSNIMSNVMAVRDLIPCDPGDTVLSFLPICHIFERTASYAFMNKGLIIQYAESVDKLRDDLVEFKPHFFTTVPRLLEKVYERVVTMAMAGSKPKQKIFLWALGLTEKWDFDYKPSFFEGLQWKIADKLVFSKIRERVGGNIKGILTGAAACPVKIQRFFNAAGIPLREAYGLTETSPGICSNKFQDGGSMLGTVGQLFPDVTVKIDLDDNYGPDAGEILVKGPNIMMGYYNKPDKTAEVMDADGWFHTGDVGKLLKNKDGIQFLKITDRKKELFKTSGGKYVAPSPIESKFKEEFLIEQIMVVGDGEKFVSAVISPSIDNLTNWCKEHEIATSSTAEMLAHPKVIAEYQRLCDLHNPEFSHIEQIKKFILVPHDWNVGTGELTPTMKLKRRVILEKYKAEIEKMYKE